MKGRIIKETVIEGGRIEDLYKVISDLERYPEFLPVDSVSITPLEDGTERIEMIGRLGIFSGKVVSRATYNPPHSIHVEKEEAPLDHFTIDWNLQKVEGGVKIRFSLSYTLTGPFAILKELSLRASSHMIFRAFLKRIREELTPSRS